MQLHFYVPDEIGERIKACAKARGLPVSRYLADLAQREVVQGWPEGFFDRVIGAWHGEPLERPEQGDFENRESF